MRHTLRVSFLGHEDLFAVKTLVVWAEETHVLNPYADSCSAYSTSEKSTLCSFSNFGNFS